MILKHLYEQTLLIQGDGLRIRPITDRDTEKLLEIYGDESIYRYRPGMPRKTEALIRKLLQRFEKEMSEKTAVYLGVYEETEPQMLVGTVEIFNIEPRIEKVEIGYTIAPKAQGKGYGTRAVGALTKYLFESCEANRVTATVMVENQPSQKLLLRNGFTQEGIFREGAFWQGIGYVDIVCFARLKKDER